MAKKNNLERFYEEERAEGESTAWAISYADMISVLLCFFVLLLSISVINPNKLEAIKRTVEGAINDKTSIEKLEEKLLEFLKEENLDESIELKKNELGVDISIRNTVIFASGSANVASSSQNIITRLLGIFSDLPNSYRFEIEGHTDDVPINTAEYPSNWHLSTARALSMLDIFLGSGYSDTRFQVQGFADTMPSVPNLNSEGRPNQENRAKNRRVVIKVR